MCPRLPLGLINRSPTPEQQCKVWSTNISAVVLISPCYETCAGMALSKGFLFGDVWCRSLVAWLLLGEMRDWTNKAVNQDHRTFWTTRYPSRALIGFFDFLSMAMHARHERFKVPVLTFASPRDVIVRYEAVCKMMSLFSSERKDLRTVEHSDDSSGNHHNLCGRILCPESTDTQFIDEIRTFFNDLGVV